MWSTLLLSRWFWWKYICIFSVIMEGEQQVFRKTKINWIIFVSIFGLSFCIFGFRKNSFNCKQKKSFSNENFPNCKAIFRWSYQWQGEVIWRDCNVVGETFFSHTFHNWRRTTIRKFQHFSKKIQKLQITPINFKLKYLSYPR